MAPRKKTNAKPKAAAKGKKAVDASQEPTNSQVPSSVVPESQPEPSSSIVPESQPENPMSQSYNSQFYGQDVVLPVQSPPLPYHRQQSLDLEKPLEPQEFALLLDGDTQPSAPAIPAAAVEEEEPPFADQPKTPRIPGDLLDEDSSSSSSLSTSSSEQEEEQETPANQEDVNGSSSSNSLLTGPLPQLPSEPSPAAVEVAARLIAPLIIATDEDILNLIGKKIRETFGLKRLADDRGASPPKRRQVAVSS